MCRVNPKYPDLWSGLGACLFPALLLGLTSWQLSIGASQLDQFIRQNARLVLTPGQKHTGFQPRDRQRLYDRNPERPLLLYYPASLPEPTYILAELGLSHSARRINESFARNRKPVALYIWNGRCLRCPRGTFEQNLRIKKMRLEILSRPANNIDKDYYYPPLSTIYKQTFTLPDQSGPFRINLTSINLDQKSRGWPQNMRYLIAKLIILDVYGARQGVLAIGEMLYQDQEVIPASNKY